MTLEIMSSAQLARVEEILLPRRFRVQNDGIRDAVVTFDPDDDTLFCNAHARYDNCSCSARVRLSGLLTHSVVKNIVVRSERKEA